MRLSLDEVKKLQQKKYRARYGYFLAEGQHLVLELERAAQHNPALRDCHLYVTPAMQDWPGSWSRTLISEKQMAAIADTASPQGIIALVPLAALNAMTQNSEFCCARSVYFYEIQDPGNLGTVLRTMAWFGGFRCLLSPGSVDPFNAKVVRASMGALFHVPVELDVSFASLHERFNKLACLDLRGIPLTDPGLKKCDCYVFGNEARGLPASLASTLQPYAIDGCGAVDSLNLAAAVNMCLYEVMRQA